MKIHFFVPVLIVFTLTACGGGSNPDKEAAQLIPEVQKVGSLKAEILNGGDTLQFSGGTLEGVGLVRFADPLSGAETANNFMIGLALDEGASATLIANSKRDLTGGIEIQISRPSGSTSPTVIARIGSMQRDLTSAFAGAVDVAQAMVIWIDVHNNHGNSVHVVAWSKSTGSELIEDIIPGKGLGANWGLRLQGGRVTSLVNAGPRDQH